MKKPKPTPLTADAVVKQIPGTKYVILPDNTVARRLTSRTVCGKVYFNLIIDDKYLTVSVDKLNDLLAARAGA
jgi:hypothetical protein